MHSRLITKLVFFSVVIAAITAAPALGGIIVVEDYVDYGYDAPYDDYFYEYNDYPVYEYDIRTRRPTALQRFADAMAILFQ